MRQTQESTAGTAPASPDRASISAGALRFAPAGASRLAPAQLSRSLRGSGTARRRGSIVGLVLLALASAALVAHPAPRSRGAAHSGAGTAPSPAAAGTHAARSPAAPPVPAAKASAARAAYAKLPLAFEANRGQTDSRVRFLARGAGYSLFLTPREAVLSLTKPAAAPAGRTAEHAVPAVRSGAVVRMRMLGANAHPALAGSAALPGVSNYMIGSDRSSWHTGVRSYRQVRYRDVYPGTDLLYYGRQGRLEYDFLLRPKAKPTAVRFALAGAKRLSLDSRGDLVIDSAAGALRQRRPVLYQQVAGRRRSVSGGYVLLGGHRVGLRVGAYDHARSLVIDPVLAYSTYVGGNAGTPNGGFDSLAGAIAVNAAGEAYVAGTTTGGNFPTTTGAVQPGNAGQADVFLTKLNAAGTGVLYSTYLGGGGNDGVNRIIRSGARWSAAGVALALDSSGAAYLAGPTSSTDFPTKGAIFSSGGGFVAKVDPSASGPASLVYSTYFPDPPRAVAVGSSGSAYLTGSTASASFPITTGAFQTTLGGDRDAFLSVLNPAGSAITYSTYLGGGAYDSGAGVAVDGAGKAYVAGTTRSTDFPTQNAFQAAAGGGSCLLGTCNDAVLTVLDPSKVGTAALLYSTYLGTSSGDSSAAGVALRGGTAYVEGATGSTDFPTKNAYQSTNHTAPGCTPQFFGRFCSNIFVSALDTTAAGDSSLVYSTYLGGSSGDEGFVARLDDVAVAAVGGIAVDSSGDAYVTGTTASADFPTRNQFQDSQINATARFPNTNGFVSELGPDGSSLVYSSFLGGRGSASLTGIAVDGAGSAYVAGANSRDGDFPTLGYRERPPDGRGGRGAAGYQAVVAKVAPVPAGAPVVKAITPPSGPSDGATAVRITGSGFTRVSAVSFGGVAASSYLVVSSSEITAVSPAHAEGDAIIRVTTSHGTSPDNAYARFLYAKGAWRATSPMPGPRVEQTATLLANGKVLIVGGTDQTGNASSVPYLYDAATELWSTAGTPAFPRRGHIATLLDGPACRSSSPPAYCGKVLVAGGDGDTNKSAELYDPTGNTWSRTGDLTAGRTVNFGLPAQYATLLDGSPCHAASPPAWCGKVLVAGGSGGTTTELYNPASGTFTATGSLSSVGTNTRLFGSPLADGRVMVRDFFGKTDVYDAGTGTWSAAGASPLNRSGALATLLADGRVLVAAGTPGDIGEVRTELFDPAATDPATGRRGTWAAGQPQLRSHYAVNDLPFHGQALLPDGSVLIEGGTLTGETELFDPASGAWSSAGFLGTVRAESTATLISGAASQCGSNCGNVLVVGGIDENSNRLSSAELYTPVSPPPGPGPGPGPGPAPGAVSVPGLSASTTPPSVTGYGLTNNPFVVSGAATPLTGVSAKVRTHKKGTRFRYTLSEAATVRIVIAQRAAGRRKGTRCVASTRKLRRARTCTRVVGQGALSRRSHLGANSFGFSGRIGSRALKPGRYTAMLIATDAAGHASRPQTISFTIAKR